MTMMEPIFLGLAYHQFLRELKISCDADNQSEFEYLRRKADRALCPRRPDFNRLYYSYCTEKYGARNGSEMFEQLDQVVIEYKAQHKNASVAFQAYEESGNEIIPFILVIVTEQMKRIHQLVRVYIPR